MFHACNRAKKTSDRKLSHRSFDTGPSTVTVMATKESNGFISDRSRRKRADPELSGGFDAPRPPAMAAVVKGNVCVVSPYAGPFRDNIRQFLKDQGERQTKEVCSVGGFPTWRIAVVSETSSFPFSLYVVQENVQESSRPFCDSCRCVGV